MPFASGRALIVGVASYRVVSKLPENVLNDARDLKALLTDEEYCGYLPENVKMILDREASADRIRRSLMDLATATNTDETVIVFFSGHGGRVEEGPDHGTYLIPFDCDPLNLRNTAIETKEFTRLLRDIRAARLVVILDACHSAGVGEVKAVSADGLIKAGLDDKIFEELAQGSGRVIVASSRSNEVSLILPDMRNSLFTFYLLEALRGGVQSRGDGLIRVFDVFHHVSAKVAERAQQHPILKAHDVETNFPLVLESGGKCFSSKYQCETGNSAGRPACLSGKTKIEIHKGLVTRWRQLSDYYGVPLVDRSTFGHGADAASKLLDWLEERRKLSSLFEAFADLGWNDLLLLLDPDPRLPHIR